MTSLDSTFERFIGNSAFGWLFDGGQEPDVPKPVQLAESYEDFWADHYPYVRVATEMDLGTEYSLLSHYQGHSLMVLVPASVYSFFDNVSERHNSFLKGD